jgi:hypothetical protein
MRARDDRQSTNATIGRDLADLRLASWTGEAVRLEFAMAGAKAGERLRRHGRETHQDQRGACALRFGLAVSEGLGGRDGGRRNAFE